MYTYIYVYIYIYIYVHAVCVRNICRHKGTHLTSFLLSHLLFEKQNKIFKESSFVGNQLSDLVVMLINLFNAFGAGAFVKKKN